jgi:hypothetical protein
MLFLSKPNRIYRIVAALGVIVVIILILSVPDNFKEPDDWAYYYATENFSHGRLVIDSVLHQQQVDEAKQAGGHLIQYIQIEPDKWVFEKAPGYVYFLIPFHLFRIPQMANILLAIGLAVVTYLLLKRLRDERLACLGVILMLYTPVGLAMLQREYMDSFAATAFIGCGGGLYILFHLYYSNHNSRLKNGILLLAGLLLGWGIATRYTNATVVLIIGLHFITTRILLINRGFWQRTIKESLSLAIGLVIPIGLLLLYHQTVFGSPWDYGYEYTSLNVKFAYEYLGNYRAWDIIITNMSSLWVPLLKGFPILIIALPSMVLMLFQKMTSTIPRLRRLNQNDYWPELNMNLFLLLLGWFFSIFGLYIMYEWTAMRFMDPMFIIVTRFYLPALLPMALFAALLFLKIPKYFQLFLILIVSILGVLFFAQSSVTTLM